MQWRRDAADDNDSRHSGFNRANAVALTTKVGVNDGRAAAHRLHHGHGRLHMTMSTTYQIKYRLFMANTLHLNSQEVDI